MRSKGSVPEARTSSHAPFSKYILMPSKSSRRRHSKPANCFRPCCRSGFDGALFLAGPQFQIRASVIVRAKLLVQLLYQLAERLAVMGHRFGQEHGVQHAVALRPAKRRNANAATFFSANRRSPVQHPVANVFEADGRLIERAANACAPTCRSAWWSENVFTTPPCIPRSSTR